MYRYDQERNARKLLETRYEDLCKKFDCATKRAQADWDTYQRESVNSQCRLDQESKYHASMIQTVTKLGTLLHYTMVNRADLSEDEKEEQMKANYPEVVMQRDALEQKCKELEQILSRERNEGTRPQRRPLVLGKRKWP